MQFAGVVLVRKLLDALLAHAACADLRLQIALAFTGRAHVEQNQVEHLAVKFAAAHNAHRRDSNAFLKNLFRRAHGASEPAAHIRVMGACGDVEGGRAAAMQEDRKHHGDVGQMGSACVGIVEDRDVTGRKLDCGNGRRNGHGHGAEMHRHVVAHGDDFAAAIEYSAGVVAALLDVGRERGASQGRAHFLGDRVHGALKDGELDRIAGVRNHARTPSSTAITRFPKPSTCALEPGGNSVAAVYSVIIAGPDIRSPGTSFSRW